MLGVTLDDTHCCQADLDLNSRLYTGRESKTSKYRHIRLDSVALSLIQERSKQLNHVTGGRSKTFGLATKGRDAILMGGHLAKLYCMNPNNSEMATSTYYTQQLPDWVLEFNQKKILESHFGKTFAVLNCNQELISPKIGPECLPDQ